MKLPRPNILRGADGVAIFPPQEAQPLVEAMYQRLRGLDETISRAQVRDLVEGVDESEAVRALQGTLQARAPEPMEQFRRLIRRKAQIREVAPSSEPAFRPVVDPDDDDPFAFDR